MRESRHQKFVWTIRHDCALVDSVLALGDMLADPIRSYPRTKFWASVSDELHLTHQLARNSRQCRDRFNLLFSRALLVPAELRRSPPLSSNPLPASVAAGPISRGTVYDESSEADLPIPSEMVLESRLQMCVRRFRFGNGRSLELNNSGNLNNNINNNNNNNNSSNNSNNLSIINASNAAAAADRLATTIASHGPVLESPPPPPRTGALHELIHPPDSPSQTTVARPEARFADLALIHSQLHHVHSVLGTLTTDVAQLKAQVTQLQQCLSQRDGGDESGCAKQE
ncbi:LAFA_0G20384g1_1 [Lachancea sp. 'fantastica']|nr:LAFA_0G20384g1_1 [Lachancea sp. 'fantastica']